MNHLRRFGRGLLYALGLLVAIAAGLLEILSDLAAPPRRRR